ncbi:uncharacterized protein LOC144773829 [Lissotriton helveticus]
MGSVFSLRPALAYCAAATLFCRRHKKQAAWCTAGLGLIKTESRQSQCFETEDLWKNVARTFFSPEGIHKHFQTSEDFFGGGVLKQRIYGKMLQELSFLLKGYISISKRRRTSLEETL